MRHAPEEAARIAAIDAEQRAPSSCPSCGGIGLCSACGGDGEDGRTGALDTEHEPDVEDAIRAILARHVARELTRAKTILEISKVVKFQHERGRL